MEQAMDWLFNRLGEKSTWVGIAGLLATAGVSTFGTEAFVETFSVAGVALISLVVAIIKEAGSDDN